MRKQFSARLTGFLLSLAICIWGLASIVEGLGTGGDLMLSLMRRYAPSVMTGLPEEEYPGMCGMITDYLAGSREEFQYQWSGKDGVRYVGFHDYEQQHMEDVRSLFVLDRTVLMISTALGAVCVGLLFFFRRRTPSLRGMRDGAVAVVLLLAGLLVWGLADFDSFFVAFHHLAFTNGLWLLNPSTDLLIRLMPEDFFMAYARIAAISYLPFPLLLMIVPQCIIRKERKQYAKQSVGL
ncbi:MAG: TIGR01906 family membrane protein [Clostridia bacterium]|nr:TIGR01906 family membrane protein [Clostridia bacterium]